MELKIIPSDKNIFPVKGLLIRNPSVVSWIKELQNLNYKLDELNLYPVPDVRANSVWGCLVVVCIDPKSKAGKHELCQAVSPNLFIPEKSLLQPSLSIEELQRLFSTGVYIIHPEFGLAELTESLNFQELLDAFQPQSASITKPCASIPIPKTIRSFQIQALPPEEILKNMAENIFPRQEKMIDEPLNAYEKVKLGLYRTIFAKEPGSTKETYTTSLGSKLAAFFKKISKSDEKFKTLQQDFEHLEKRNQKHLDRLLDMLKNDPEEALKYAIPLDQQGSTRGSLTSKFELSKRWSDFSLFDFKGSSAGSSGSVELGDNFGKLESQYKATAEDLIKRKQYQKAAFIYMKLLKDYAKAADVLEEGKLYQEAATIHMRYTKNKPKAAECYEKGNMTAEAIALYKEMNQHEKVGDLYLSISNTGEAFKHYYKVVDDYKSRGQFVKASILCKEKIKDIDATQSILLEGWKVNREAVSCLNHYFSNFPNEQVGKEIGRFYRNDINEKNRERFLTVLQYQYKRQNTSADYIREIAYEIIAEHLTSNPSVVSELKVFNPDNKELMKDTLRFKFNKNQKKN
jgi:hypothetical protein